MSVETIIAAQQAFAQNALSEANSTIDTLNDLAGGIFFTGPTLPEIRPADNSFDASSATRAALQGLFPAAITTADISAVAPTYTPVDIDPLGDVPVPDFGSVAPTLEIPSAPSNVLPSAPTAPSITDPTLPSAPVITLPTAPSVGSITLPEPPSIALPSFTSTLPVDTLVVPSNTFEFYEVAYQSALLDAVQAKLLSDLENGGYGIETNDEAALFDRARSRELESAMQEAEALIAEAAARGFPLPPGDMAVALQRAQQNMQNKMAGVNRDIALKRADMYVENRKFTIEQVRQLEQVLIGYHNSVMERALNAAKATLEAAIRIYDAQVSKFNAQLDAYKTEAQVFEARIRAALAQVEIFRVQMEGKRLEVDIQRAQVDVYNAQLNGVNLVISLYKTQMEAAQVQANIERLRIDAFKALVDAYAAQVQSKVAEFNMYEAQIKGEVAKVQAFESEVKAYTATVDGAKAKTDILIARLKGQIEEASQGIEVFKTRMAAYQSDIDAQAKTIDARVRVYGAQVQGAASEGGVLAEALRVDLGQKDLVFRADNARAQLALEDAKIFFEAVLRAADISAKAGGYAADYYKAFVSGAVNSINTLAAQIEPA